MAASTSTHPVASGRYGGRVLAAAGAVGLVLAVLLALVSAPTAVRTVVVVPLLVGVGGAALSAALVPEQRRLDGVTRTGLVLLLGLGLLLGAALLVALLFRDGLPADRVALADAVLAAVPLAVVGRRPVPSRPAATGPAAPGPAAPGPAAPGAAFWSGLAGVALLAVALLIGIRMLPSAEPAPTFSFTGPAATAPGPGTAMVGGAIALDWALRHTAAPTTPSLTAVVDGQSVPVTVQSNATGDEGYRGSAVLTAPAQPGLHRIVLAAQVGGSRLELVSYVDVKD